MTARHLILVGLAHLLIAFGLLLAALSLLDALEPPPLAMPLLVSSKLAVEGSAASTAATFVCTPTVTPRIARIKPKEIV